MQIKDFTDGSTVDFTALIRSISIRETKNGKEFGALELVDSTGSINGNLWDINDKQKAELTQTTLVHIIGSVESYQGAPQLKFTKIEVVDGNPTDYVPSAPVDLEKVTNYLTDFITSIQNPRWRLISEQLMEKFGEAFYSYPAALKVHHAYAGGLAFHTSTMLLKAQRLAHFYPFLNKELLCVGVLLHDLGKTIEMPGLFGDKYTTEGELLGHIEIILEEIVEICVTNNIDHRCEDILLLKHLIAAHHGKLEWGTISEPRIPEAAMLHIIDKMDAEMEQYRKVYESLAPGEWTQNKEFFLGNKRVYRPRVDGE